MVFQLRSNQVFVIVCLASLFSLSLSLGSKSAGASPASSEGLPERREQGGGSRYAPSRYSTFQFTVD